jgi:hypothetical protein
VHAERQGVSILTMGAMAAYTSPRGVSAARRLVWDSTLLPRVVSCHTDREKVTLQSVATSVGHGGRMLHSAMSSAEGERQW